MKNKFTHSMDQSIDYSLLFEAPSSSSVPYTNPEKQRIKAARRLNKKLNRKCGIPSSDVKKVKL